MRSFALVIFDIENKIIDRFNIDLATEPVGLGFKLKLNLIEGEIENTITKVVGEKQDVAINIIHKRGYSSANLFVAWIEKYSHVKYKMGLEYDDGILCRYVEGKVIELTKTELSKAGYLLQSFVFKPITPFFINTENTIKITMVSKGKCYPLQYPYCYGRNKVENNEINNTYINEVPITIKITGIIGNPTINLVDEDNVIYNTVDFSGVVVQDNQYILINSADCKIWFHDGDELVDFSHRTNPLYDTFLRAKTGKSRLSINLSSSDTSVITGSWRQYLL